jgi:GT2 family glycosyltransferase
MTLQPDLSIIVVTHNGRERALATLESARAATGPTQAEWLIVDSGSTDGVADAIERAWPELAVRRLANVGFAAANNAALPDARGRYVLLLNPDVDVVAGTFADLVLALDARPSVGAASVVQTDARGDLLPSIRRFPSGSRQLAEALLPTGLLPRLARFGESETRSARYADETSADWLVGAFLVLRREALETVGGLDERFFLYSEETDLCHRVRAAGWDVRHLTDVTVVHHAGGYDRPELLAQRTHSKLLFARKHLPPRQRIAVRTALALGHAVRAVALSPLAALRPRPRRRLAGELRGLQVSLGLAGAPFATPGSTATGATP